jgi:hypothetical protein
MTSDKDIILTCLALAKVDAKSGEFPVEEHHAYMAAERLKTLLKDREHMLIMVSEQKSDFDLIRKENEQLRDALQDAVICIVNYSDPRESKKVISKLEKIRKVL